MFNIKFRSCVVFVDKEVTQSKNCINCMHDNKTYSTWKKEEKCHNIRKSKNFIKWKKYIYKSKNILNLTWKSIMKRKKATKSNLEKSSL